jgi:hypothetical protein
LGGRRTNPFRPLTLIFGPNSAGKSAILQSLLLHKQTAMEHETGDAPIRLKCSLVDLSSFREMAFRHELDRAHEITPNLGSGAFHPSVLPGTKSIPSSPDTSGIRSSSARYVLPRNVETSPPSGDLSPGSAACRSYRIDR